MSVLQTNIETDVVTRLLAFYACGASRRLDLGLQRRIEYDILTNIQNTGLDHQQARAVPLIL